MGTRRPKVVGALWTLYDDLMLIADQVEGAAELLDVNSFVECDAKLREAVRGIALVSMVLRIGCGLDPLPIEAPTPHMMVRKVTGGGKDV